LNTGSSSFTSAASRSSALPLDATHLARELHLLRGAQVVAEVLQHARAHGDALADVERRRALAVEQVHAGRIGNLVHHRAVDVRGERRLPGHLARRHREHLVAALGLRDAQELPDRLGVAHRTMPRTALDAVARDQAVEVVARMLGVQAPRELHGTERLRAEGVPGALEFVLQETVVEARVVRDHDAPGQARE
jgi:hypothetical protein